MASSLSKFQQTGLLLATCLLGVAHLGCGSDSETKEEGLLSLQECNPLGGNSCITPWPTNLYAKTDSSTVSGMRLDIPEGALPTSLDAIAIDPAPLNKMDGFSAAAPILVAFEGGVDGQNLVPNTRFDDSLLDSSPTVLIDMSTGERVLHFAELDIRDADQVDKQALYIRPAVRLTPKTRYAVGIRKSLKSISGSDLPISPGFAALVDGTITKHERLEARRSQYQEVLAAMTSQGIATDDLVVAWDFTTASDESIRQDLTSSVEQTLAAAGTKGANLSFEITSDETDENFRKVEGTFTAPLLLTLDGAFAPGSKAMRDASGLPQVVGMHDVPFTAVIPTCALSASEPVSVIVYGHGLLGLDNQAASGSQRALAEEMCAIVIGTIMRGMSTKDISNVLLVLNNYNLADQIFDPMLQGINNHIALVQAIRGPMAESLFVDDENNSLVNIENIYYYGLSQGGIFGATIVAYDPHIKRAALGVGAANYSMMLERSLDWPTYRTVMIGAYDHPLHVSILLNLMQMRWDATEPTNVIADLPGSAIPGRDGKQILMQIGIADSEVPNLASEYEARTMGLSVLGPATYAPYGIPEEEGPLSSGLVIYDKGFGPIPDGNLPPEENEGHYISRNAVAARRQIQHFFETGEIIHTCGAGIVCDCTTDACD